MTVQRINLKRASSAFGDVVKPWVFVVLTTTIPYLVAALRTPEGHIFTGIMSAYDDSFTYLAWIKQSADGRILLCDLFTSEPHPCSLFLPLWGLLGQASRLTGLSNVMVFHAGRLLSILVLLLVARQATRLVMRARARVRFTVWLYALSSGFGWLIFLLNENRPEGAADLNIPEAIAFRSSFAQVHLVIGAALTCGAIACLIHALIEGRYACAPVAGALASILAAVHPYMIAVVFAVGTAAILTAPLLGGGPKGSTRTWRSSLVTGAWFSATALPGVAYLIYVRRSNPVLVEWLRTTSTASPSPLEYLYGFGLVGLFAIAAASMFWKRGSPAFSLLIVWAAVQAMMLYAPVSFQRRFVEGLQMPLTILASIAIYRLAAVAQRGWPGAPARRRLALAGAVLLTSITNAGFLAGQLSAGSGNPAASDPRRYISQDLAAAYHWLDLHARHDRVILSSYLTGNLAPSMTGRAVYLGHYDQTLRSREKGELVARFFAGLMREEEALSLLAGNNVGYVVHGPFERAISPRFRAPVWLAESYSSGEVKVYRVER